MHGSAIVLVMMKVKNALRRKKTTKRKLRRKPKNKAKRRNTAAGGMFLKRGGEIETVPMGATAYDDLRQYAVKREIAQVKNRKTASPSDMVPSEKRRSRCVKMKAIDDVNFEEDLKEYESNREKYRNIRPRVGTVGFNFSIDRVDMQLNISAKRLADLCKRRDAWLSETGYKL